MAKHTKIYGIIILLLSIMIFSGHFLANPQNANRLVEDAYNSYDSGSDSSSAGSNNGNSNADSSSEVIYNLDDSSKYDAKGYCDYVVDGDTIDVEGVGRIRLVGVNTPERGESGYQEAKDFVSKKCLGKTIYLDIDDKKNYDKYGRVLAVVYVDNLNINQQLLKLHYAEVLYIPPSEFNPYSWT